MENNEILSEGKETEKKRSFKTVVSSTWFIITASITAVILLVAVMVLVSANKNGITIREVFGFEPRRIDYLNDNIDKYISIEESDYKGYDINIDLRKPDSLDVDNKVIQALAKNKGGTLYNGEYQEKKTVNAGDRAFVYYSGYILDENGNRAYEIAAANNFIDSASDAPMAVNVGGGGFVLGFELGLIGKTPQKFKVINGGTVEAGDIVYATATYIEESGLVYDNALIRIDLSDPEHENRWGENIISTLQEKRIGLINGDPITLTCPDTKENITYTKITVNYVIRGEYSPIVIETYFPHDYEDASLRNKTVYYDVFIDKVLCYETPEFNDDFVLNTLKMTNEQLEAYEGVGAAEKCRSYYMSELLKEYEENRNAYAEEIMWERLSERANVKKYPEREVDLIYEDYLYSYTLEYARQSEVGYSGFDQFMTSSVFNMQDGADWQSALLEVVHDEIKEKLIFYYIIRKEGLELDDEAYAETYRRELELDFAYYLKQEGKDVPVGDEYEKALLEYEKEVIDYYGEDFYRDSVYYNYALEKIMAFANIIDNGDV